MVMWYQCIIILVMYCVHMKVLCSFPLMICAVTTNPIVMVAFQVRGAMSHGDDASLRLCCQAQFPLYRHSTVGMSNGHVVWIPLSHAPALITVYPYYKHKFHLCAYLVQQNFSEEKISYIPCGSCSQKLCQTSSSKAIFLHTKLCWQAQMKQLP